MSVEELDIEQSEVDDDHDDRHIVAAAALELKAAEEGELRALLTEWGAPVDAPAALHRRVLASYRHELYRVDEEEEAMKTCPMCGEEFAPQFKFCPVDGLPLGLNGMYPAADEAQAATEAACAFSPVIGAPHAGAKGAHHRPPQRAAGAASFIPRGEYHLTFLADAGLWQRLTAEVREVSHQSRLTWPEFQRDPLGFTRRLIGVYAMLARRALARENLGYGVFVSFVVLLTIAGAVVALSSRNGGRELLADKLNNEVEFVGMVTKIPQVQKPQDEGRPGLAKGTGGGSKVKQERPSGGGGGGQQEATPASAGKPPQASLLPQVLAPNPHPPVIPQPHLPTAATMQVDPALVTPDTRPLPYGLLQSKATEPSAGSGTVNGIGDGQGGGIGTGEGTGYGPGRGLNLGNGDPHLGGGGTCGPDNGIIYDRTFKVHEVTRKANITSKPEPGYSEEARKNNVTGEVSLRLILAANGSVTGVRVLKGLPDGLTEKAISAAKQIKFTPAEKDGRKVAQYVTVAYSFNIY